MLMKVLLMSQFLHKIPPAYVTTFSKKLKIRHVKFDVLFHILVSPLIARYPIIIGCTFDISMLCTYVTIEVWDLHLHTPKQTFIVDPRILCDK